MDWLWNWTFSGGCFVVLLKLFLLEHSAPSSRSVRLRPRFRGPASSTPASSDTSAGHPEIPTAVRSMDDDENDKEP